ncbi:MAG: AAA family ATPase [Actinomycetota bacterium]|nr:AAA family ATPase [Actinomycetota bacterium]
MPNTRENWSSPGGVVRTFLISDIRGYSTFTRERGDETAARLATRFADLARDAVEARGGRVIELRGDEALAVFDSTPQAVRAGLEFQLACLEATDEDLELPLPVGVGIDCGEAIPVEDGYRGAALNLAARLCSKAAAGQVLVTKGVAENAQELEDVAFEPLGAVELKGFDRPIELLEARSTSEARVLPPQVAPSRALPSELDDFVPLADRESELRWLRGTWRQARRGHGRLVFVSGPAGIGKTRLAAELAAHLLMSSGAVRYAGPGGAGGGETLAAIAEARSATTLTLCVLDELHLYKEAVAALAESVEAIESRQVLLLGLFREAEGLPALAELVDRVDVRGDGHRRLNPLGLDGLNDIARCYVGDVDELPAESMLRASGGVPARVHEVVSGWARDEAKRRLAAAAEWLAAGKSKQAAGLEFANNAIALKLGRIYELPSTGGPADSCPYKGLAAFEESDAAYFYGRERLVGELAARTVGMGLLSVVGPSGGGKSSVVMAGLVPSLATGLLPGSERWGHVILRPGEHPVDALDTALASGGQGERLVLVVDQFEEVFSTTANESERAAFVDRLVELARDHERCVVVVTIRADYTGHCAPYPELADLLTSNLMLVGPMTPDELRRAIELPARRVGLRVESALVDALVDEVAEEPGGLPLLSTALVELWQARDGGWLRLEAHERTGGLQGAVARLAEASFGGLGGEEREAARAVLLRLVGRGDDDAAVRRRVPVSEFDRTPAVELVLNTFTRDRLLTAADGTVEVAHEALIREWPRLRAWLEEDVQGRELRAHITQAAKQWDERGRDLAELYRGTRLSITLDWAARHGRELNELEREFLSKSREASEQEAEKQRKTNRRLQGLLVGTVIFLAVALVAGSLALVQRSRARNAQAAAEAEALRSDAQRIGTLAQTEPNLDRSLLLAVAGVQLNDLPETRGDLLAVLQKTPDVFRLTRVSRNELTAIAVSPDGRLLASGDSAGEVRFHDLLTWKSSGATVRLDGYVSQQALAFSPDGGMLAVATATGGRSNLFLVDVASRTSKQIGSWPSIPAAAGPPRFARMAFSPDGQLIAVAVATATPSSPIPVGEQLFLLEAASGRVLWERKYPLRPGQNEAQVEFTSQGTLVTSAWQGDTLLWNTRSGRIERRFSIGGPFAVSPDGHLLALAQNNENPGDPSAFLAVLDLRTGTHRSFSPLPARAWIVALQFTPDGNSVLTASFEGAVRVWDLASGSIVQTFAGHPSGLNVAVAPDGRTAVAGGGSGGGSVAAWDLSGEQRLASTFRWNPPGIGCPTTPCFVVNARSTLMAGDQGDGSVALIDLRTHRVVGTLPASNGPTADALAFSPDGRTLATGGLNGSVTFWNVRDRAVVRTLRFPGPVWWVAISPDGKLLAVQTQAQDSSDSRVEVRNIASDEVLYRHVVRFGHRGLAFSPDGRQLAALGCCEPSSTIEVWDARSGAELFSPRVDAHATSIAFSPDGGLLGAGTEDGNVVLWNARDGTRLGSPIPVATSAIDPISFSPDGRLLVGSSDDQTATLWDLRSRKRLGSPFIGQGVIPVAYFAPSGDLIIDFLGHGAQWPTDLQTWERFACQVAGRDLTQDEWSDLLPDRPYQHVCPQ